MESLAHYTPSSEKYVDLIGIYKICLTASLKEVSEAAHLEVEVGKGARRELR